MRKAKEINEYLGEAFDMVWLVRTLSLYAMGDYKDTPNEILKGVQQNVERICKSHNLKKDEDVFKLCEDWQYGYWSGILAALRWVKGEEKDVLDT